MQRRIILMTILTCAILVSLSATGLSSGQRSTYAATAAATMNGVGKKVRIALVLIGPQNDGSWAEAAVNALNELKAAGYDTAVKESVADSDAERVKRSY